MSVWSRVRNVFRADAVAAEIDEELRSHVAEAVARGRGEGEARRALGPELRHREHSRDLRILPWLDSLRADAVFGWRQLRKRKVTSAAAVASLALAIGSSTAAFRLIDALLLRGLPVAHPEQLYLLGRLFTGPDGKQGEGESFAYPDFALMSAAVKGRAELIAISYLRRSDLSYANGQEVEKAHVQYVSGNLFDGLGVRPAAGRLLRMEDNLRPGAHPVAVISQDYWTRRFGRDPKVVGRTFHFLGSTEVAVPTDASKALYQIVGVVAGPFTGTETGQTTDIFLPAMMHPAVVANDWTWIRILARIKPEVALEPVRARLDATSHAFEAERSQGFQGMSAEDLKRFLNQPVLMTPARAGASDLQKDYGKALATLAGLVALVLLIACVNVANLKTAQAAARAREMALRVSIGAGRWRLAQLALVESALLAALSAALGMAFASWAAPLVVRMIRPQSDPAQLAMPFDWRVAAFGLLLTFAVACLFGLGPALRAGAVQPASAMRGGVNPHAKRRVIHGLVAAQMAFCFLVLFVAALFVTTFDRLSHEPLGFSPDRVIALDTVAQQSEPAVFWDQVVDHLRAAPGVESASVAGWALLNSGGWNGFVSVNGAPPGPVLAYFLSVSPGWIETMRLPLLAGRDLRPGDSFPGAALINETFARDFFGDRNPIGQTIAKGDDRCEVVGIVHDAPYRDIHEQQEPVAYVPFHHVTAKGEAKVRTATFLVRTASADPTAMASALRREVPRARPEMRVRTMYLQSDLVRAQTLRERLLAMLAVFFAAVALLLAGVGLYGVLDYSVIERRREIGIRMAIGAEASDVAWGVTSEVLWMLGAGTVVGVSAGLAASRYIASLLYQVKPTDPSLLAGAAAAIALLAMAAALPAVLRAVRTDPASALRPE